MTLFFALFDITIIDHSKASSCCRSKSKPIAVVSANSALTRRPGREDAGKKAPRLSCHARSERERKAAEPSVHLLPPVRPVCSAPFQDECKCFREARTPNSRLQCKDRSRRPIESGVGGIEVCSLSHLSKLIQKGRKRSACVGWLLSSSTLGAFFSFKSCNAAGSYSNTRALYTTSL